MSTLAVRSPISTSSVSTPEGPITGLAPEVVTRMIFLTTHQDRESTSVVCHTWHILTLVASKQANQADVEQFTSQLAEQLDPEKHPGWRAYCQEVCRVSQSLNQRVTTVGQAERLFLIINGFILRLLGKLTPDEKCALEKSIGPQIPSSMALLFELTSWDLKKAIESDLSTFYIVLQSKEPLLKENRGLAVLIATEKCNKLKAVQLLLANGRIDHLTRDAAMYTAARNSQTEMMELFREGRIQVPEILILSLFSPISWNTRKAVVRLLIHSSPLERLYVGLFVVQITMIFGLVIYGINLFRQERKD